MNPRVVTVKPLMLLPPREGLCQTCAILHAPEEPHDASSFYYQTKFKMDHDRAATWEDAWGHCSNEMKSKWKAALTAHGVDWENGGVRPMNQRERLLKATFDANSDWELWELASADGSQVDALLISPSAKMSINAHGDVAAFTFPYEELTTDPDCFMVGAL